MINSVSSLQYSQSSSLKRSIAYLGRYFAFWQVFEENLAINPDPEKFMYLFVYLGIGHPYWIYSARVISNASFDEIT